MANGIFNTIFSISWNSQTKTFEKVSETYTMNHMIRVGYCAFTVVGVLGNYARSSNVYTFCFDALFVLCNKYLAAVNLLAAIKKNVTSTSVSQYSSWV